MKKVISYLVPLLACTHLLSCATIVSGSKQNIPVNSIPQGATLSVEPDNYQTIITPGELVLERDRGPYRITFNLDGYEPYSVTLTTSTNGWVWGNLLLGGIIGIIVDSSSGAGIKLTPEQVEANLIKESIEPPPLGRDQIYFFSPENKLLGQLKLN